MPLDNLQQRAWDIREFAKTFRNVDIRSDLLRIADQFERLDGSWDSHCFDQVRSSRISIERSRSLLDRVNRKGA